MIVNILIPVILLIVWGCMVFLIIKGHDVMLDEYDNQRRR